MAKRNEPTTYVNEDGVTVTVYPYRGPRKGEKTYDVDKSRYTAWHQGVVKYTKGTNGVQGTVENVDGAA